MCCYSAGRLHFVARALLYLAFAARCPSLTPGFTSALVDHTPPVNSTDPTWLLASSFGRHRDALTDKAVASPPFPAAAICLSGQVRTFTDNAPAISESPVAPCIAASTTSDLPQTIVTRTDEGVIAPWREHGGTVSNGFGDLPSLAAHLLESLIHSQASFLFVSRECSYSSQKGGLERFVQKRIHAHRLHVHAVNEPSGLCASLNKARRP